MKIKNPLTIISIIIAVFLIIIGIVCGQPASVFAKAARICLECIGIG